MQSKDLIDYLQQFETLGETDLSMVADLLRVSPISHTLSNNWWSFSRSFPELMNAWTDIDTAPMTTFERVNLTFSKLYELSTPIKISSLINSMKKLEVTIVQV